MSSLDYQENKYVLAGPAGNLELVCDSSAEAPYDRVAIICHPHPLYGGTMHNKVVTTLAKAYKDLGFKQVIRFNYRGVGKSEGSYAQGQGEQDDLLAVVAWASQFNAPIWLAGFSFGAYVAASAANKVACQHLTCIAPPVVNFNFDNSVDFSCPWLVVQGDQDEVVEASQVYQWFEGLAHRPTLIRMPQASHFFHGQLLELRSLLTQTFSHYL